MRLHRLLALLALAIPACAGAALAQPAPAASPAAAPQDAAAYMAGVAHQPGVVVTPSGLAYKVNRQGPVTGQRAHDGDLVKVEYEGRLTDGTLFDSSENNGGPLTMAVGQLVPGWNEALQLMRPGDDWTLYLPPSLGYGDRPAGPIPPGSVMVFRLKLLAVNPTN